MRNCGVGAKAMRKTRWANNRKQGMTTALISAVRSDAFFHFVRL
jgi:hypothetical protein